MRSRYTLGFRIGCRTPAILEMVDSIVEKVSAKEDAADQEWSFREVDLAINFRFDSGGGSVVGWELRVPASGFRSDQFPLKGGLSALERSVFTLR